MKILIVVDMQNDFVTGVLGTKEAQSIVPNVVNKVEQYRKDQMIIYTRDSHFDKYYENSQEGKYLPIKHCIYGTNGHELIPELLKKEPRHGFVIDKDKFGYINWAEDLVQYNITQIELCGVCTDICVVSNALILKATFPEVPIIVDAKCCAGATPEKHKAALEVMKSCQIDVIE